MCSTIVDTVNYATVYIMYFAIYFVSKSMVLTSALVKGIFTAAFSCLLYFGKCVLDLRKNCKNGGQDNENLQDPDNRSREIPEYDVSNREVNPLLPSEICNFD